MIGAPFNARLWLTAWDAAGGIVVRTAGRLTLAQMGNEGRDSEICRLRVIGLQPSNAEAIIAQLDTQYRGETDNIYIRCAIQAFADDYPGLAEKKGSAATLKVRLFNYSEHTKRLMGIAGGSGHFNNLIKDYRKNLKPFTAPHAERFPVILLVDNDSGADGIYKVVKATTKTACDGKEPFYYVGDNLYVVPTPLGPSDAQTMIEDFLPTKWRAEKLGGKTLNLGKDCDITKEYGKALFAEHVIKRNRKDVDFTAMRAILDRIVTVIDDYAAMMAAGP